MRKIKYSAAINEAFHIAMEKDKRVFQIGVGINTPWYVGQTMNGLLDRFGEERMIDPPVSENGTTGVAIGAALAGFKPILTFARMDFMYYAFDQIINHAASFNYSLGGNSPVPLVIRAIINRKGEQAANHSQSLHGLLLHIPGLKIVMPSNAYDAKGMLLAALEENNPIIYIDDRELYNEEGEVPEGYYTVPIGTSQIIMEGNDLTMISSSFLLTQCKIAAQKLKEHNIDVELIDLRSIKPLDSETIINSVKKTGRLVVVDGGWNAGGVASEVISIVATHDINYLKSQAHKIALPDLPAPASFILENSYYPSVEKIVTGALSFFR
jgi:pyruvate/2-oxoglutarate/acetoin dehydrogenase E1 component